MVITCCVYTVFTTKWRSGTVMMYSSTTITADNDKLRLKTVVTMAQHQLVHLRLELASGLYQWRLDTTHGTSHGNSLWIRRSLHQNAEMYRLSFLSGPNEGQNVGKVVVHSSRGNVQFSARREAFVY